MNIYFVNRYSKLKGPFDIIDSNRKHIIKVGDICLRDTIEGVVFYVVYSSTNMWNACKLVGIGKNDTLSETGNTLLFSFDGLSRRKGDIKLIEQLTLCFREKVIDDFFRNAVDILEYKKDFWDGSLFPQFFASSQEFVNRDEKKKPDVSTETSYYPTVFAQYLSKELQELLTTNLNEGYDLKEAYLILREKHPELFRKALMKFLTENPSSSIYDEPADAYIPAVAEVESPRTSFHDKRSFEINEELDFEPLKLNERINNYLIEIGRQELLTIYEEIEFAQKVRKGEIDARNKLVSANMRFVVGLAKQYLHTGLEFEDLLHEGFLGLIKAAEHFDETRGFSFISYAAWWIRRYITDAILRDPSLIRFPLNVQILHKRIWDFKIRYERQMGFMPPITDIEIEDEDNLERISFLDNLPYNLKNICIPCEDYDVFEDNHNDIWDYEDNDYNKQEVRSLLAHLSKRERDILIKVYGIGVKEETLESIGESWGLTRERVRQIKEKAVANLRKIVNMSNYKDLDHSENDEVKEKRSTLGETERKKHLNEMLGKIGKSKRDSFENPQKESPKEIKNESDPKRQNVREASVGDRIMYNSKPCIVLEKSNKYNIIRLKVRFDDGRVDNVSGEQKKYVILNRHGNDDNKELLQPVRRHKIVEEVVLPKRKEDTISTRKSREELYDHYTQLITRINQAIVHGKKNLAKPALLVAVIDEICDRKIHSNRILITTSLEERYNSLLAKYTGKSLFDRLTSIAMPFWYLQSDKFWFLASPFASAKNFSPSKKWLINNVDYARLDDDLWYLLQDEEWRNKLRNFIIIHKLLDLSTSQDNNAQRKKTDRDSRSEMTRQPKFHITTSLNELVRYGIITDRQLNLCYKKGLRTIGDVKKKIDYHHLTPDSTRFTKYTLDMWFGIVGLLKDNV